MFYLTEIGGSEHTKDDDPKMIYYHAPNEPEPGKWHPLHDIASKVYIWTILTDFKLWIEQEMSKESKHYECLVAQLNLFGKLCKVHLVVFMTNYCEQICYRATITMQ